MINHTAVLLAMRARLLNTVAVSAAPDARLFATDTGYGRINGSFVAEGFAVGMEVAGSGFNDNAPRVIEAISDDAITTRGLRQAEPYQAGVLRALNVSLPSRRAWEGVVFAPEDQEWYVQEQYLPGPVSLASASEYDNWPVYVLRLYGLAGTGISALYTMADAVLAQFRPPLQLPTSDGHTIYVRSDTAPYRGQMVNEGASHAVIPVTIPLWVRTNNAP